MGCRRVKTGVLLDTCAAIWVTVPGKLSIETRALLDRVAIDEAVFVSPITAWEVAGLVSRNRLTLRRDPKAWFAELLAGGFELAPMTPDVLIDSWSLPRSPLRDPADRILAATARSLGCPIVTRDRLLLDYAEAGWMQAISC